MRKNLIGNDTTVTNANAIIGKKAIVTKEINSIKGTGKITVDGDVWSAKSTAEEIITEGTEVLILRIDGVKAIVEKAMEKTAK